MYSFRTFVAFAVTIVGFNLRILSSVCSIRNVRIKYLRVLGFIPIPSRTGRFACRGCRSRGITCESNDKGSRFFIFFLGEKKDDLLLPAYNPLENESAKYVNHPLICVSCSLLLLSPSRKKLRTKPNTWTLFCLHTFLPHLPHFGKIVP